MTPYYADDYVTLYHGDCRELLRSIEADVVITDPPYGIGWRTPPGPRRAPVDAFEDVTAPDPSIVLSLGLPTVMFGANHYADRLPPSPAWLVWDKREGITQNDQADAEMAWSNLGGVVRVFRYYWNGGGSLARENMGQPRLHPTQKPVALMRWVIERCPPGTILDPFAGSGSTLVAAKSLNRRAIGIEIEERYCEVAANRLRQEVLGLSA